MNDRIMKAFVRTVNDNLRNLYVEKKLTIDDVTVIVSIYRNIDNGQYYCATAIVDKGEYVFSDDGVFSGYYSEEVVMRTDVCSSIFKSIKKMLLTRSNLLTYLSNSKEMPNLLHAAFNKELTIYYTINNKLITSTTQNGVMHMQRMKDVEEQNLLTNILESANIRVTTFTEMGGFTSNGFKAIGG